MTAADGATAVANARQWHRYSVGMCLKWVRGEAWQIGSLYGSAIDAWHGAMHKHPGDRTPPIGAPCFYSGGAHGHIVIWCGPDMRSTDCTSSGQVSEAPLDWPHDMWGSDYLGWTEDLNGVMLPLGDEDDEMNDEDFQRIRSIVADELAKNNNDAAERVWTDNLTVTKPNGEDERKSARQTIRETWQRIAKG